MNIYRQSGLSLVEILVALVISLFLLGGVIQVYTGNRASYNFSEGLSRIQENARFAMDSIKRDIRMAGFRGCATDNFVNNLNPAGKGYKASLHKFFSNPSIEGTENDGVNKSDSITIRGAAPGQTNVLPPYNSPTSAQIFANNSNLIEAGDIVLISNCNGADLFQITNITKGEGTSKISVVHNTGSTTDPGNHNPAACKSGHCLSQTYGGDSSIIKMQTVTYSIGTGESGEPALFRSEFDDSRELVDGIEQLQILYGINTDSTDTSPNQYVKSTDVIDWSQVTAVRVMLLVRSHNNVPMDAPQKYTYNDELITSDDQLLRQVFSSTIAIRNVN
jgi:type IV pilus assembly protein PilW